MCRLLGPDRSLAASADENGANQHILPNGLKVVLLEDHSLPVVSCFVWYRVGARNETASVTGISHIVEHLLFQNVGRYRKGELGATIVANGGQFNGFTSDDFTTFFETIYPTKLALALRIESERMRGATFTEADLKHELARVKAELEQEEKDPLFNLNREVHATAYVRHSYRNPASGWKSDLDTITWRDAKEYYDRYFHPNNATLVIVGDFKTQPTLAAVAKYFETIPRSAAPIPDTRIVEPRQLAERRVILRYAGKKDQLEVAYHGPACVDADAPAMMVLEKLLNASLSGKLKIKLVDTKCCNWAKSAFELKHDPALFTVSLAAPGGSGAQKLLEAWDALAGELRSQPVSTDSELKRAKNQAEFALLSESDSPYKAGFQLGYFDMLQSWQMRQAWNERVRNVTASDLLRVCKKYLTPENRVVGVLAANCPKPSSGTSSGSGPRSPVKQAPNGHPLMSKTPISQAIEHVNLCSYKDKDDALAPGYIATSDVASSDTGDGERQTDQISTEPSEPKIESGAESKFMAPPAAGVPEPASIPGQPQFIIHVDEPTKQPALNAMETAASEVPKILPSTAAASSPRIHLKTLKNGTVVIVLESHLTPIVQIEGAIKAGDVFDPVNKKGMSDLCAHLLSNASGKQGRLQMAQLQEDMGLTPQAMLKFECGPETINFRTRCLSRDIAAQLNLLGSSLKEPQLQDADIEKAKADLFAALKGAEDSVTVRINRALLRSVLASNSAYYPVDPSDKARQIDQLKSTDVKDFFNQYITPDATVIVIAGDISAEKAFASVDKAFDGWSVDAPAKVTRAFPAAVESQRRLLKASIPFGSEKANSEKAKTMVSVGRLMNVKSDGKDYSTLLISDCALCKHPLFSRMILRLNGEPGLADSLSFEDMESRFLLFSNMISWSLTFPVEASLTSKATSTIQIELTKFTNSGISAEELAEIKRYLTLALPVQLMSSPAEASINLLNGYFAGTETNFLTSLTNQIRSADLESVNRFIKNQFKPDQSVLIIAGTAKSIKQVSVSAVGTKSGGTGEKDETEMHLIKD